MLKVGFTGTRLGMTEQQKKTFALLMSNPQISEFHHGDCVGADAEAHSVIGSRISIHVHPPTNTKQQAFSKGADVVHLAKGYLDRNHDIVDATDVLVAVSRTAVEELRSGTWATVRYARQRHKRINVIYPDGTLVVEGSDGT